MRWRPSCTRRCPRTCTQRTHAASPTTSPDRLENVAGRSPLEASLRAQLTHAMETELHAPLPAHMHSAHARGFADYFSTAKRAAAGSAAMRKRRSERPVGPLDPGDTGEGRRN